MDHPDRISSAEVELWTIDLDQSDRPIAEIATILCPEEQARAARFVGRRDQHRYINGRFAMRQLIGRRLNRPPGELAIDTAEYGKPRLCSEPRLQFNLSHSEGLAILAMHESAVNDSGDRVADQFSDAVGVDVEWVRPIDDLPALMQRCLCKTELENLLAISEEDRLSTFYEIWVRKEAGLKALGLGFEVEPHTFDARWLADSQRCQTPCQTPSVRPMTIPGYPEIQVFSLSNLQFSFLDSSEQRMPCHVAVATVGATPKPMLRRFSFGDL